MVYVISRKYLDKHGAKLVAPNEYIIIDGENMGSNASGNDDPASQKYNKCIIRGGLCPERETINIFKAKKAGKVTVTIKAGKITKKLSVNVKK